MNEIKLKGVIKNTQFSHMIGDIEYYKSDLIIPKEKENDILSLRYKKFSNQYEDDNEITLVGNIRSYSERLENGKNKVNIYVFTYFDTPEEIQSNNEAVLDGRICKKDTIRMINGHKSLHFILANNIISANKNQKLNNYIPCIALDDNAELIAKMQISDILNLKGALHSRDYIKALPDGTEENHTAYEFIISEVLEG